MTLTEKAKRLIEMIENAGYEAYFAGGCVRDFFMRRDFSDIDIATSAKPFETEKILSDNSVRCIETGLAHGTVTAYYEGDTFEITTYRADGEYSDFRHPESVLFVDDISGDLSRRDFTINAMAYNPKSGKTIDLFGGRQDIKAKKIRAVGDPDKRFREDALRIMRALRFSSVLGFEIEEGTKRAILKNKELLLKISAERIFSELLKLLSGKNVFGVLCEYKEVIAVIIPEFTSLFCCTQNTVWHIYDAYTHTCKTVEQAKNDPAIRLIMLLHDLGKPQSKTTDENGVDHFKGHQKISAELAHTVLKRFKVSNELYTRVMKIIPIHDIHIGTQRKNVKKWLSRLGKQGIYDLISVKRADKLGQNPAVTGEELRRLDETEKMLDDIISSAEPYSLKDLAVNGFDLMENGIYAEQIGIWLRKLLELVVSEELENDKTKLIEYIKENQRE